MRVAVGGCCHGELDAIYSQIARLETQSQYKVDVLLICGDFQAVRNRADLQCMAVPNKYRELKDFHKYYSGLKTAPILTIVIGGNHEASNYMWELYHGGWLAQNIYFLGHAGSVFVNGILISGASGIFKAPDFSLGSHERLPYDATTLRSIYHIREFCVRKLSLLQSPDIFLSHDWPHQIEHYGNLRDLLARKNFLRADIEARRLGSPPLMGLLKVLRPRWWFSAHLHTRYEAQVVHNSGESQTGETAVESTLPEVRNPDEIIIDDEEVDVSVLNKENLICEPLNANGGNQRNPDEICLEDEELVVAPPSITKFLALDKCLPKRQFLEILDINVNPDGLQGVPPCPLLDQLSSSNSSYPDSLPSAPLPLLCYDPRWLAITRAFQPYFSTTRIQRPFPDEKTAHKIVLKELAWVMEHVPKKLGGWEVSACQRFSMDASLVDVDDQGNDQPPSYANQQTSAFCALLDIENKMKL